MPLTQYQDFLWLIKCNIFTVNSRNKMTEDIRWQQRFANYEKAYVSLRQISEQKDIEEDILIDATLKRFDLVFELAWKTLQDYLQVQGYTEYKGPAKVLAKALQDRIIENNELWGVMHEDRNILAHVYDYDKSRMIYKHVVNDYLHAFTQLFNKLKNEPEE